MSNPTSFWSFSLAFYARSGVAEFCLDLQDRFDVDVNILLYLLWQASRQRRLDADEIGQVIALTADWRRRVVLPLRAVRRFLKEPAPSWPAAEVASFRERIKADELQAERLQQESIERQFANMGTPTTISAAARANCDAYAQLLNIKFPEEYVAHFASLLSNDLQTS